MGSVPLRGENHPAPVADMATLASVSRETTTGGRTNVMDTMDDSSPIARELAHETKRRERLVGRKLPKPKKTRIFTVSNQKGGVGKTTTTINLAAAVANKGFKTLLVDLDPQANSSMSYIDPRSITRSMYDVLVSEELKFADVIVETSVPNLSLAPSRISLAKLESKLIGELDGPFRLKDKMKGVVEEYDYVFIDTPPTLGMITVNALVASTHVLVPIQSSYFALEGTDDLLETIEKIKARPNPNLQLLGVVITMHDKRTTLAKDIHDQIGQVFGDRLFNTVITKSIRLEESPAYKESIFTFAPKSSGAMEYYSLSEELLSRV